MKLQNCFTNDKHLRQVFSWLTRIGAAPKFGSRPIGWYQQHQCAAIDYLEKHIHCGELELRCRGGMIEARINGKWVPQITAAQLDYHADNFCRTGKF